VQHQHSECRTVRKGYQIHGSGAHRIITIQLWSRIEKVKVHVQVLSVGRCCVLREMTVKVQVLAVFSWHHCSTAASDVVPALRAHKVVHHPSMGVGKQALGVVAPVRVLLFINFVVEAAYTQSCPTMTTCCSFMKLDLSCSEATRQCIG
jgi:hypothetical protein